MFNFKFRRQISCRYKGPRNQLEGPKHNNFRKERINKYNKLNTSSIQKIGEFTMIPLLYGQGSNFFLKN